MATIQTITAREIIDSRGVPTIEVFCTLASGAMGVASVPSGASTGVHEALELRDGDQGRYGGRGVQTAIGNIREGIATHVIAHEHQQRSLDDALIALDGTANKSRLGANAILGVSMAFARACAHEKGVALYEHLGSLAGSGEYALPEPAFNIINGGKHADSGLDIQEFMIVPIGIKTIREKVRAASEIIATLKRTLHQGGYSTAVGDEGGFAPSLPSNEAAFELLAGAIAAAGYTTDAVKIAIDAAASSFFHDGTYTLKIDGAQKTLTSEALIGWYAALARTYPLISIEDGLAEDDFDGFAQLNEALGNTVMIVGDDLTVTNKARIQAAIDHHAISSVLIKPNQIGTITETIEAVTLTKKSGLHAFASHRSGETTDTFIADLAVGLSCAFFKSGSLARGERVCKYNRLMEIESHLPASS